MFLHTLGIKFGMTHIAHNVVQRTNVCDTHWARRKMFTVHIAYNAKRGCDAKLGQDKIILLDMPRVGGEWKYLPGQTRWWMPTLFWFVHKFEWFTQQKIIVQYHLQKLN